MSVVLEDCHHCGTQESLTKIPALINLVFRDDQREVDHKPGQIVKQHIEEAKRDVKQEKELMMREYEP